ncbi:hypothetical protein TNCV_1205251, partial [Trichonephila clavipes]
MLEKQLRIHEVGN